MTTNHDLLATAERNLHQPIDVLPIQEPNAGWDLDRVRDGLHAATDRIRSATEQQQKLYATEKEIGNTALEALCVQLLASDYQRDSRKYQTYHRREQTWRIGWIAAFYGWRARAADSRRNGTIQAIQEIDPVTAEELLHG